MINKLDELRSSISDCLAGGEKAYDLPSVCIRYSLDGGDEQEAYRSKRNYVSRRIKSKKEDFLIQLSKNLIQDYQNYNIGNSLNKYLNNQFYELTEVTRKQIIDSLKKIPNFTGSMDFDLFLLKAGLPFLNEPEYFDFFDTEPIDKNPITALLGNQKLYEILDSQFISLLEQLVYPMVRDENEVNAIIQEINPILKQDNFALVPYDSISGRTIYKCVKNSGVKGVVKNLIFASNGYKPEIVITDALNNDLKIVKNKNSCLVFDKPIPLEGLKWVDLVAWWAGLHNEVSSSKIAKSLFNRLMESLDSLPEKEFFKMYYNNYKGRLKRDLPALIPQVYLHYDPYTIRKHGINYLLRQRIDFLILFSNRKRVVIEIDGKQHYSENENASPRLYSQMVELDRELKFLNYDVFRLGGYELTYNLEKTTKYFFDKLFEKYK